MQIKKRSHTPRLPIIESVAPARRHILLYHAYFEMSKEAFFMSDYRNDFIKEVENELVTRYDMGMAIEVSDIIARVLSNYEITGRCTEIVPLDDRNTKLLKRYSACLLVDGKSKNTVTQYIRTLEKLSEKIQKPFPEMGKYDIRLFLAFEKERGISNKTLENRRSYISAFFQWMVNDEVIIKNPIALSENAPRNTLPFTNPKPAPFLSKEPFWLVTERTYIMFSPLRFK